MSAPNEPVTRPASSRGWGRRIAAAMVVSAVVFLVLWIMAVSVFTSLLISAGFCAVVVCASVVLDPVVTVLDLIATVIFGVLAVIGALIAAIFGLFGW